MIEDPPLLVVKRTFPRPPASKLARLKGAQTAHVVDAMDGRGALDAAIKAVDPERSAFIGTALTVETGPSDNLAIVAALSIAKPGDVIVAASDGFRDAAVVGDIVCAMGRNAGLAALVIDGMARDLVGIKGVGLPVFSRGITPNSCVKTGPGRIGFPIVAGGVAIQSGDVLVGDLDGAVVIPEAQLDAVIRRVDTIRKAEAAVLAKVAKGLTHMDAIAALMKSDKVKWVE
jgi:4-hydroxy-4-methyl-2-oxoglutarate aldolase